MLKSPPAPQVTVPLKPTPRRALSVNQPWAFFIVCGLKDVENRSWAIPVKYVGSRVFIHASREPLFDEDEAWNIQNSICPGVPHPSFFGSAGRTGGIIGAVTIAGCIRDSASPWATPGSYHWLLRDAEILPFKGVRGYLGFFTIPA